MCQPDDSEQPKECIANKFNQFQTKTKLKPTW